MMTLALVIPCKNEYRRLRPDAFLRAVHENPSLTFIFVDDGSTDQTAETLAFLVHESPAIHALYLPQNKGKAQAVRTGIQWVLQSTTVQAVGFWDADLATPLEEIPGFLKSLTNHVAVIGARWPHLGGSIERTVFRKWSGLFMRFLIRLILRAPVYDTQCGAKIFTRALAQQIFEKPFLSRWLFDVELLKRIPTPLLRTQVVEQPLSSWRDVPGSQMKLSDTLRIFYDLIKIACTTQAKASH